MNRNVYAVVGGQFGSEGKGAVVARIANHYQHHVRTGAANAGHTFYTDDGGGLVKHVMQQLPCAAYANPYASLYIGPGAIISRDILIREMEENEHWRVRMGYPPMKLFVDRRAHMVTGDHVEEEEKSGLAERIGSTSAVAREGIGAAQAARVMRRDSCQLANTGLRDITQARVVDVPYLLARVNGRILLEGTQGYGLSLTTGAHPWITSRNTTAAGLCADAGIAPARVRGVCLVVRTFPIRVAGPSGPFAPGSVETDWESLGIDPRSELTTVTKKVRRVATFSFVQVREAAAANGATSIALMFGDYLDPGIKGVAEPRFANQFEGPLGRLIREIESGTDAPVTFVGTGPHTVIYRVHDVRDDEGVMAYAI